MLKTLVTITTAATDYDLVSLTELKNYLGVDGTNLDDFLNQAITDASTQAANFCNNPFVVEVLTNNLLSERDPYSFQVPGGMRYLQLSRWPVTAITSVVENGTTLVVDVDFKIDGTNGQLIRLDPTSTIPVMWSTLPVLATGITAGYATVPADVKLAVKRMVKAELLSRKRDPFLKVDDVQGVGRQEFWIPANASAGGGAMSPDVQDLLDNYRVPVVG